MVLLKLFASAIGVAALGGIFYRAFGDWPHVGPVTWLYSSALFFGVWAPFILFPYLRESQKNARERKRRTDGLH